MLRHLIFLLWPCFPGPLVQHPGVLPGSALLIDPGFSAGHIPRAPTKCSAVISVSARDLHTVEWLYLMRRYWPCM